MTSKVKKTKQVTSPMKVPLPRYVSRVVEYYKKCLQHLKTFFLCLLDEGIAKIWLKFQFQAFLNYNLQGIEQPIKPIWQQFFTMSWSFLKKS